MTWERVIGWTLAVLVVLVALFFLLRLAGAI
jgi:hypothetical protein